VELEGKAYLVREIIAQRAFEALTVRTARASDCKMGRDVGLRQVVAVADSAETRASLRRAVSQAQRLGQAASGCPHLPQVYSVVEQEPGTVWVIVEWIQGTPIDKLMPQDGPLPGPPSLRQLLYWAADACDALSALHRRRISHGGVSGQTILITPRQRGPVLIDPGFTGAADTLPGELSTFDPIGDVRDLAAALYRVTTHHLPQPVPASRLNPFVPQNLDEMLRDALGGSICRADQFKRRLREVQATLRTA
jgi:serine/threonine protein kinase